MDMDTVIESVRYRCWGRGESYEAFVREYSSASDLEFGIMAGGLEGEFSLALLELKRALGRLDEISSRIEP